MPCRSRRIRAAGQLIRCRPAASIVVLGLMGGLVAGCGGSSSDPADRAAGTPARREAKGFDPQLAARLQETLERVSAHQGMPGAAAAVVMPGAGVWTGTTGYADRRTKRKVTDRTQFAVGSVTKPFVAALLLRLAERDVLDLDDHLSRWVPGFPHSRQITIRQLLNHTAGTTDFTENPALWKAVERDPAAVWTPKRTLRYGRESRWKPGETWKYSSTGYILAGLVIERATHSSAARQLHRRLFEGRFPRIALQGDERPRDPVAVGHQNLDDDPALETAPDDPFIPSTTDATVAWTAGGMAASAGDLARAADGVLRGDLISDASRREMTRFTSTFVRFMPEYGLGLGRVELGGEEVWAHGGDTFGFHADLAHLPDRQITVAALNNLQQNRPGQDSLIDALVSDVGAAE